MQAEKATDAGRDAKLHDDKQYISDDKVEVAEAQAATAKEHKLTLAQALKAYPKAIMWSILLSSAVIMEGYDTLLVSVGGKNLRGNANAQADWLVSWLPVL